MAALAAEVGGAIPHDPGLLDEVTDLVEQPTAIRGNFAEEFLRLPKDVLITVMKKHQRYFPVVDAEGELKPYFITVRNGGAEYAEVVQAGNEGVIRARYADAAYFYKADAAHKLEAFTPRLATLTFQEKLGSMLDKVRRLEQLAPQLGRMLGLSESRPGDHLPRRQPVQERSGDADGRRNDLAPGDHGPRVRPSFRRERRGCYGDLRGIPAAFAGRQPAGGPARSDPGAGEPAGLAGRPLRGRPGADRDGGSVRPAPRCAGPGPGVGRSGAIVRPASRHPCRRRADADHKRGETVLVDVLSFVRDRLYAWLRDQGLPHDVVAAVLAEQAHDPYRAAAAARELAALTQAPDWTDVFTAYARCKRIVRALPETYALAPEHYTEEATRGLYDAWQVAKWQMASGQRTDVAVLGEALRDLQAPINRFFTDVLVMAEDPAVRQARLALVQRIAALPDGIADLSQLQGF